MKLNKRAVALLISLALLATAVVGATVAFIFAKSDPVNNTFTPSRVTCQVLDKENHTYTVENTADPDACVIYVRVAVLVNWKNSNGFYAQAPAFQVYPGTDWILGSDGYYYFTKPVAVGAETATNLKVTLAAGATEPDGYDLSVEVVASAIQATADAVAEWSNAVQVDGEVLAPK